MNSATQSRAASADWCPADTNFRETKGKSVVFIDTAVYGSLTESEFFLMIGTRAAAPFVSRLFFMQAPVGAFAKKYPLSSFDREMMAGGF